MSKPKDLVYTLTHYGNGPESVAAELTNEERESEAFSHAVDVLHDLFASEVDNGPAAYGNFVQDRSTVPIAYAAVQDFLGFIG